MTTESDAFTLVNSGADALIIALHGLGGDRQQPLTAFGEFGPQFAVLAPDQRAHGRNHTEVDPTRLTFDSLAHDVVTLVEALGQSGKPTYVAGISMGAAVALRLLVDRTLDIRGASLVRPAFTSESIPRHLALMPMIASLLRTHGPDEGVAVMAASGAYRAIARESPIAAASLLDQFHKPAALARVARLSVIPSQRAYVSTRDLADIDCAVQVVGVHGDPVHPLEVARAWHAAIPRATLVEAVSRDAQADVSAAAVRKAVARHVRMTLE